MWLRRVPDLRGLVRFLGFPILLSLLFVSVDTGFRVSISWLYNIVKTDVTQDSALANYKNDVVVVTCDVLDNKVDDFGWDVNCLTDYAAGQQRFDLWIIECHRNSFRFINIVWQNNLGADPSDQ